MRTYNHPELRPNPNGDEKPPVLVPDVPELAGSMKGHLSLALSSKVEDGDAHDQSAVK